MGLCLDGWGPGVGEFARRIVKPGPLAPCTLLVFSPWCLMPPVFENGDFRWLTGLHSRGHSLAMGTMLSCLVTWDLRRQARAHSLEALSFLAWHQALKNSV